MTLPPGTTIKTSVPFWLLIVSIQPVLGCTGSETVRDQDETTTVEGILEGYVRATGGRPAHGRIRNRVTRGRAELRGFPNMDWTASFVRCEAPPGSLSETLAFNGWKNEEGTDGEIAWGYGHVKYPGLEHRLKTPAEIADMAHLAVFDGHLSWRERYETVHLVGTRTVDGTKCHEIVLTPGHGQPVSWFVDAESLLLVKIESRLAGTTVETHLGDYREVDGVLLPHRVNRHASGASSGSSMPFLRPGLGKQDLLLIVDSVQHNVDSASGGFSVPAAIRTLANKQSTTPR